MTIQITFVNAQYQDYKIVSNGKTFLMNKNAKHGILVRRGNVAVWGKDLAEAFNGCVRA